MLTLDEIVAAERVVRATLAPTPALSWPLIERRLGARVVVKHENHNPTGAFKVRGGLTYMAELKAKSPQTTGVIAATRGNHGQSIAHAAKRVGLTATIVVPHGNSREKNAAMTAYGAELVEYGADFQEALEHAIVTSCRNKAEIVGLDERETGPRALLNYGHTFGHAIEAGLGYGAWLHGEAVACGRQRNMGRRDVRYARPCHTKGESLVQDHVAQVRVVARERRAAIRRVGADRPARA